MDPPYGLGTKEPTVEEIIAYLQGADLDTGGDFMGKDWEVPSVLVWRELSRVLKPGGYVLTFGGTRTWDIISIGARVAGFEYRDTLPDIFPDLPGLLWMQSMGMPHGLDISKAIDKDLGVERKVVGSYRVGGNALTPTKEKGGTYVTGAPNSPVGELQRTVAGSEEAAVWEGWHTNLKPAWEPILVFRKPLEGTIVENIRKWGTGAINIDGTRIYTDWNEADRPDSWKASGHSKKPEAEKIAAPPGIGITLHPKGRWPPNVVMVHSPACQQFSERTWGCVEGCPVLALDGQSGVTTSGAMKREVGAYEGKSTTSFLRGQSGPSNQHGGSGGASRFFPQFTPFFYTGKATKRETTLDGEVENNHPTKKPVALMAWLVRLVTPLKGIVLDPYCGSGSTLHAACEEGFRFTGIERDPEFCETARKRMEIIHGRQQIREGQRDLFDAAFGDFDE